MPIKIAIIEDFASIFRGTQRLGDAFDDVADSLDDVADESKDSGRTIERSFRDSFDNVSRHAKRATDDVADDTRRNMRKAGDATGDFRREAVQNVSETASSWDGSMEGITDMVQGTMGGLADLPGVGLAVAGLGAAGGAVAALWQQHNEAIKQNVQDMFDDLIASGEEYLSQSYIQEQYWKIIQGADGAILKQSELNKIVERTGLSSAQVALAYAGDQEAIVLLQDALIGKQDALTQSIRDGTAARSAETIETQSELSRMLEGLEDYAARIDVTVQRTDDARAAWNAYAQDFQGTTQGAINRMQELGTAMGQVPRRIPIEVDLSAAERSLRTWRPVVTATVRAGQRVV